MQQRPCRLRRLHNSPRFPNSAQAHCPKGLHATADATSAAGAQPARDNCTGDHLCEPKQSQTHLELHSTSKQCTALHCANELYMARLAAVIGKREIVRRVLRGAEANSHDC